MRLLSIFRSYFLPPEQLSDKLNSYTELIISGLLVLCLCKKEISIYFARMNSQAKISDDLNVRSCWIVKIDMMNLNFFLDVV